MSERVHKCDVPMMVYLAGHLTEALLPLSEELPDYGQDIRKVITTLLGIKACLEDFGRQYQDPRFNAQKEQVLQDIIMGIRSCSKSLRGLNSVVYRSQAARPSSLSKSAKKKRWNEITLSFKDLESVTLVESLDEHRKFLLDTISLLRTTYSSHVPMSRPKKDGKPEVTRLRSKAQEIASEQEEVMRRLKDLGNNNRRELREMEENFNASPRYAQVYQSGYPTPPSSQDSPPQRPYSVPNPTLYRPPPVQYRPPPPHPTQDSYYYMQPPSPYDRHSTTPGRNILYTPPISPVSPTAGHVGSQPPPPISRRYSNTPAPGRDGRISTPPSTPPMAPRPALKKPSGMARTASAMKETSHWWAHVFNGNPANTRFGDPPRGSACYGKHTDTLNITPRDVNVFSVTFDSDLKVNIHRNVDTYATKVVGIVGTGSGSWDGTQQNIFRKQVCTDANGLTILRVGSGIHLMRRNIMWAELYFGDYETLTLFYNAFLALRYYGPNPPPIQESEMWPDGEDLLFSGRIHDHGFEYRLRVLKDQESGSIRLAAAKEEGRDSDTQKVTVWTAFISSQIPYEDFIQFNSPDSVILHDIRQFSFSSSFDTKSRKRFELKFKVAKDAQMFYQMIDQQRRLIQQERPRRSPTSPPAQRSSYFVVD